MDLQGRYVLVGNSAAALAAIDWIRKFDRDGSILVLNRERGVAYSRVALPYFVSGERTLESLRIRQPADYARLGVRLVEEAEVTAIDPRARAVVLRGGSAVRYEKLLLATGSEAVVPPIEGLDRVPHHYLWTLQDAMGMKQAAERATRALVIGGGFIGMLAAEALRKLRMRLTIVEMADQLMPQLLDAEGGRLFGRAVRAAGVDLRLGSQVAAVEKTDGGIRVRLRGGEEIETDLLAVAAGVRPCLSCVRDGAVRTRRGIVVDASLRTDQPDVFAAGDVAEVEDFLTGQPVLHAIWPSAVDQGRIAGANMAGAELRYPGSLGMNVVGLFGLTLAEIGRFREGPGDSVERKGSSESRYRKVVVDRNGTVVGAMYLGDPNGVAEMGVLHHAIKRREKWRALAGGGERAAASYAAMFARVPVALPRVAKG